MELLRTLMKRDGIAGTKKRGRKRVGLFVLQSSDCSLLHLLLLHLLLHFYPSLSAKVFEVVVHMALSSFILIITL